jgi:hypothetical protein
MSAVRQVIDTYFIPVDPKQDFCATLPSHFLADEPQHARIADIWETTVRTTINLLCRARKSRMIHPSTKRAVFQSGMERVCTDFSRKTEVVKVEFQQRAAAVPKNSHRVNRRTNAQVKTTYRLLVTKLSAIPESLRHVRQNYVAEIPERIPEVVAELVVGAQSPAHAAAIPSVAVEYIDSRTYVAPPLAVALRYQEPYVSPPVASAAVVDDELDDEEEATTATSLRLPSSALERMRELDSITGFLSEVEYERKREAIINSI